MISVPTSWEDVASGKRCVSVCGWGGGGGGGRNFNILIGGLTCTPKLTFVYTRNGLLRNHNVHYRDLR